MESMPQPITKKLKPLLIYAALPILLAVLLLMLKDTTSLPFREVHSENGVWDLRDFDFENYNALLVGEMRYIPNALLTPEEFSARYDEALTHYIGSVVDVDFLTSRDIILLRDDAWYTFARRSTTYAQRQYVNSVWLSNTGRGRPGYSRETLIPDTGLLVFTAQPVDGQIELVQQSSNFVHRQGNRHFAWQVSANTDLIYQGRAMDYRQGIVMGSYFLLFLLFMLLFFMFPKNRAALYFALFCMMWFARTGMSETRAFTVLYPWMDWSLKIRLEYFSLPVAAILTLAIIDVLFPKILNKTVIRIYYAVSAVLIAVYMITDTVTMTRIGLAAYIIFGLGVAYVLVMFVLKVRNTSAEQRIFIGGMVLFLFATVSDIVLFSLYNFGIAIIPFQLTGMAVLMFALCMASAVFVTTMKEAENAKESERRLAAENAAEQTLSRMKTEFMATMSHELKTPLYVIGGYAEITEWQLDAGTTNEETKEKMRTISLEARRLSQLVDSLMDMSTLESGVMGNICIPANEIARRAAAICIPILAKNDNRLDLHIEKNCPPVMANPDMILRVFINFVENANRHVKGGSIVIAAKRGFLSNEKSEMVLFSVEDRGCGIAPEMLEKVFERGYSGDGGSGLGLSICKEAVEAHGGTVSIDSELGNGTSISFTLPAGKIER